LAGTRGAHGLGLSAFAFLGFISSLRAPEYLSFILRDSAIKARPSEISA